MPHLIDLTTRSGSLDRAVPASLVSARAVLSTLSDSHSRVAAVTTSPDLVLAAAVSSEIV